MQNNTFSGDSLSLNLIVLDEVASTNDYLKYEVSKFKPLPEFSAIMAKSQTKGRGQRENAWFSEPFVNVTFSLLLYPTFLKLQDHFVLNICISLALHDWLQSLSVDAKIKWPNDIMIGQKKICGILIENLVNSSGFVKSIVGIGMNVNQASFPEEISDKAGSIYTETGKLTPDLQKACKDIISHIGSRYRVLQASSFDPDRLLQEYNSKLYLKDQISYFEASGKVFQAKINSVSIDGLLHLETLDGELTFQTKEIHYLNVKN